MMRVVLLAVTAVLCSARPGSAQDIVNIANQDGATEAVYGTVRGWTVYAGFVGGRFAYCVGEHNEAGNIIRLGYGSEQWQLGVPYAAAGPTQDAQVMFDVGGTSVRYPPYATGVSDGVWTIGWLGMAEIEALRSGDRVFLHVGDASFNHSLAGSAATITKIEECYQRAGGSAQPPMRQQSGQVAQAGGWQSNNQPAGGWQSNSQSGGGWQSNAQAQPQGGEQLPGGEYRTEYARPGDWWIDKFTRDPGGRQIVHCAAFRMTGSEEGLRFGFDPNTSTFTFGFMGYGSAINESLPITFWFNNDRSSGFNGQASLYRELDGSEWMGGQEVTEGPGMEDAFMNNDSVSFAYPVDGKQQVLTFPLDGSNAALSGMFNCTRGD